jgi:2-hydroxy-3-keto-5-methylthiopentenyl-1-phosphate phosphatase
MHAFCDFDGTIAVEDVTDCVLERFAAPEWQDFERAWTEGEISAAECMRAQIPLIRASLAELDSFLDTIEIDPGFADFVAFCRQHGIGVSVVSDGVDYFIQRVLANHGVNDIEVIANHLSPSVSKQGFQYGLDTPYASAGCRSGAGVCKCRVIRTPADHFYVGDGRSDFCVSGEAMMVFAKRQRASRLARTA